MPDSLSKMDDKNQKVEEQATSQQDVDFVNGVACPIDPMERLQCESCQ